jgi:hypothetical protein
MHTGKEGARLKHLKSLLVAIVACITAVALGTTAAFAAVTVKSEPTIEFDGASATVSGGNLSGLGNIPVVGELTVTGIAEYTCFNPQGHPSPGQNPVEAQSGSSGPVALPTTKNGRATVPADCPGRCLWRAGQHPVDRRSRHADGHGGTVRRHAGGRHALLLELHARRSPHGNTLLILIKARARPTEGGGLTPGSRTSTKPYAAALTPRRLCS